MNFKISPDEVPYILVSVKADNDFLKVKLLGDTIHIVTINKSQILYYEIKEWIIDDSRCN